MLSARHWPPKGVQSMSETKELTYSRVGDYMIPDLILSEPPEELTEPIGKYGRMRRSFLKEHRAITYNTMLLNETLFPHLREIDQAANERMTLLMKELTENNPPPDKAADQMTWVQHMNSLRSQAEEMIMNDLIYS